MADRASNLAKESASAADRSSAAGNRGRRRGRSEELHEDREQRNIAGAARSVGTVGVSDVLWIADPGSVQAVGRETCASGSAIAVFTRQRTVLLEEFVADAHLHVVSLTGENHQRFILRFPAKAADCAIIAVMVERPRDAEGVARL